MLPDLNWDRKTMESLHLLGLVERSDIWSLRDLKKKHICWLMDSVTLTYTVGEAADLWTHIFESIKSGRVSLMQE